MKIYAFVKDQLVVNVYDSLPVNWQNITNFHAYAEDERKLKEFGWYVIVKRVPQYDRRIQKLSNPTYNYDSTEDVVYEDYTVIEILTKEKYESIKINSNVAALRAMRNKLLQESDWTQQLDVQELKSDEWKEAWKDYRQELRDLPKKYENNKNLRGPFYALIPRKPNVE